MLRSRRAGVLVAVVVAVTLCLLAAPTVSALADETESGVIETSLAGPGDVTGDDGANFVWADERTDVVATVGDYVDESDSYYEDYYVRLTTERDARFEPDTEDSLDVERVTLGELEATNVTLSIPADELSTGNHRLYVSMYEPGVGPDKRVNDTAVNVRVFHKHGDADGDSLSNLEEVNRGTDLLNSDTDDDGLKDGHEVHVFGSDPLSEDTDGDGVSDPREVRAGTNPASTDTDSDELDDDPEVENSSSPTAEDTDLDGLADPTERQLGTDPTARDTDGDGLTDGVEYHHVGSDPLEADSDGDGLDDGAEVRRFGTNPTDRDTDGDGIPDGREVLLGTDPTVPTDDPTGGDAAGDGSSESDGSSEAGGGGSSESGSGTSDDTDGEGSTDAGDATGEASGGESSETTNASESSVGDSLVRGFVDAIIDLFGVFA